MPLPIEVTHPESPADGLAAVVALRRLADRMEDAEVERAVKEAKRSGDTKIGTEHILRGLLAAEHGTVPRILAAEGIDREELTGRL